MQESVSVLCPAKINVGLKVLGRRQDGFHNLQSIFVTVPLFDKMKVTLLKDADKGKCIVECKEMELPLENTISKAYKAFCVLTGIQSGVHVQLEKCIPAGGGLGGGSSDASSFIKSIDSLLNAHLKLSDMMQLSSFVGSDVFFFTKALEATGAYTKSDVYAAVVEGRGEKVRTIPARKDFAVLLLMPALSVSTKEAYEALDFYKQRFSLVSRADSFEWLLDEWKRPLGEWQMKNDFTLPLCEKNEDLKKAFESLKKTGADFLDMSGSGSTFFALFDDLEKAKAAEKSLPSQYKTLVLHQ